MAEQHACVGCHKKRAGRFTRRKAAAGGGFSQGFELPVYYCWQCLPNGEGRGEHEEQPVPRKNPSVQVVTATILAPSRSDGIAILTPLQQAVAKLPPLKTDDDYLIYDGAFGRVKKARKEWKLRMYGTAAKPGPIPNIRAGLEQLYELNREVDKPLETLETAIENKMKGFKLEEQKRLRALEEARIQAEADALTQMQELQERLDAVKTKAARAKIAERLEAAQEVIADIEQAPAAEALKADNSSSRPVQIPVCTDLLTLLAGIVEGTIPFESETGGLLIYLNQPELNRRFKLNPAGVALYPGVEIQDDMQIRGR